MRQIMDLESLIVSSVFYFNIFLVDATFAHAALINRINLIEQLPKHFSTEIHCVVSKCVLNEAKNLGPQLNGASKILSQFQLWGCAHKTPISASECIEHIIGDSNHNHLFLASQDQDLKKRLSKKSILYL
uniref:rRNA-processing protein UTP23 homolog (Trinotate prediction) n=1 Tax=Henneguya salminicola TaxID=69463 RepID=A0A6G3MLP2_HENSL